MDGPQPEFGPGNPIVKRCLQAMVLEASKPSEAKDAFLQAWQEATLDFEKFITAYFLSRQEQDTRDKLHWLETALQYALSISDDSVSPAFANLYRTIGQYQEELGNQEAAKQGLEAAENCTDTPSDPGPFYHGTRAELQTGDMLTPGGLSNYVAEFKMNHIYFTASPSGAGLAAALAKGDGAERIYVVETTGKFEHDPNVTNQKFPGNLTRSYRSAAPLKIIGEIKDWKKLSPDDLQEMRNRLNNQKEKIIN